MCVCVCTCVCGMGTWFHPPRSTALPQVTGRFSLQVSLPLPCSTGFGLGPWPGVQGCHPPSHCLASGVQPWTDGGLVGTQMLVAWGSTQPLGEEASRAASTLAPAACWAADHILGSLLEGVAWAFPGDQSPGGLQKLMCLLLAVGPWGGPRLASPASASRDSGGLGRWAGAQHRGHLGPRTGSGSSGAGLGAGRGAGAMPLCSPCWAPALPSGLGGYRGGAPRAQKPLLSRTPSCPKPPGCNHQSAGMWRGVPSKGHRHSAPTCRTRGWRGDGGSQGGRGPGELGLGVLGVRPPRPARRPAVLGLEVGVR